jgi:hypothetical protein
MTSKTLHKAIILALLGAIVAACAPTPAPTQNSMTPDGPQTNDANLCANAFFPVVLGATWTYSSTGAPGFTEPYTFTDTITEVRADGFTLTSQFPGVTRTQEWACTADGLLALQLGSGPAGGLSTSQMNLEITTSNITGTTIPASITAGQSWNYGLDLTGEMDIAGTPAAAEGSVSAAFNAIGMENVTVTAGSFDAMNVQGTTTMNVQATFEGLTVPVVLTANSHVWLAPGVGWIKMENSGDLGGTLYTETITLQSHTIP